MVGLNMNALAFHHVGAWLPDVSQKPRYFKFIRHTSSNRDG